MLIDSESKIFLISSQSVYINEGALISIQSKYKEKFINEKS